MRDRWIRIWKLFAVASLMALVANGMAPAAMAQDESDVEPEGTIKLEGRDLELAAAREYAAFVGVSEQEAEMRLEQRERLTPIIERLVEDHPEVFAGFEIVHEPRYRFKIYIVGKGNAGVNGLLRSATRDGLPIEARRGMAESLDGLLNQQRELHRTLNAKVASAASSIDIPSGKIHLSVGLGASGSVDRGGPQRALPEQAQAAIDALPSEARAKNVLVEVFAGEVNGNDHVYGGGQLCQQAWSTTCAAPGRCSVGFAVVDGAGGEGFVTAGHCADSYGNDFTKYEDPYSKSSVAPAISEHRGYYGDFQWHTSGHYDESWVFYQGTQYIIPIMSKKDWYDYGVNDVSCMFTIIGQEKNTGDGSGYGCDYIKYPWVTKYSGGYQYDNLVGMNWRWRDTGESGGPWTNGTQAHGVHQGRTTIDGYYRDVYSRVHGMEWSLGVYVKLGNTRR